MKVEGLFSTLKTSFSGLLTSMKKLEVISENIANAEKLPNEKGEVYKRKIVKEITPNNPSHRTFEDHMTLSLRRSNPNHSSGHKQLKFQFTHQTALRNDEEQQFEVVELDGVKRLYDPSHPQANENGYVNMPKISLVEEMVNMISASRNYEANISVMNAAKLMAKKTLKI